MHVESVPALRLGLLFGASLWAGTQNQLAGGGSFITLPALILTGMERGRRTSPRLLRSSPAS